MCLVSVFSETIYTENAFHIDNSVSQLLKILLLIAMQKQLQLPQETFYTNHFFYRNVNHFHLKNG